MKFATLLAPIVAFGLVASPALASENNAARSASIAFANHGGVSNWRAEGNRTIYFEDNHRQWYKADLFSPAFDLPYAQTIGIDSGPGGSLDKWGAILVRGQRYPFATFEKVSGPPSAKHLKAETPEAHNKS